MNTLTPKTYALLIDAIERNDLTAVKNLVQQIKVVPDYALHIVAIERRFSAQMLHALLPHTDQRIRNLAMADACKIHRTDVVDVLYPLCDVPKVLSLLEKDSSPHIEVWKATLQQRLNDEKLRETLMAEVAVPTLPTSRKM